MPRFSKKTLSQFLNSKCEKQLYLNLFSNKERKALGMPAEAKGRGNIKTVADAGNKWQQAKVKDLQEIFGNEKVVGNLDMKQNYALSLQPYLDNAEPFQFWIELPFHISPTFKTHFKLDELKDIHGNPVTFSNYRTDIIQVLPYDYRHHQEHTKHACREILGDGTVRVISEEDTRLRLRVIDIKLTAEPSANYFAEVVLYSMILAAWLADYGYADKFAVVPEAAIWPGSHEEARVRTQASIFDQEKDAATLSSYLEEDLETVPYEVFIPRIRRFLTIELPYYLQLPQDEWQNLDWHVNASCQSCDFLGYPWKDKDGNIPEHPQYCWKLAAENQHLSNIAQLSSGSRKALEKEGICSIQDLAQTPPPEKIYNQHQNLKQKRTMLPARATALRSGESFIIPDTSRCVIMPKWSDLSLYILCDYDQSSALTFSFSLKATYWDKSEKKYISPWRMGKYREEKDAPELLFINHPHLVAEWQSFSKFLKKLSKILQSVQAEDQSKGRKRKERSSYQLYFWDKNQYEHFLRLVGRYLEYILNDDALRDLAWLFPAEQMHPDPSLASARSPITIVSDAINTHLAANIRHHYSLLEVYNQFVAEEKYRYRLHPLYFNPMADQLPSDRMHVVWAQVEDAEIEEDWFETIGEATETNRKRINMLESTVRKLQKHKGLEGLKDKLEDTAPFVSADPPKSESGMATQSHLWYNFARLNVAMQKFEAEKIRALPYHEREARMKTAILSYRLSGEAEAKALTQINLQQNLTLHPEIGQMVYQMRPFSKEVVFKAGEMDLVLSPHDNIRLLDVRIEKFADESFIDKYVLYNKFNAKMADVLKVHVKAIDRNAGIIVLKEDRNKIGAIAALEKLNRENPQKGIDLRKNVALDNMPADYLTRKLLKNFQSIGNSFLASSQANVAELQDVMGIRAQGRPKAECPAAQFLWNAKALSEEKSTISIEKIRPEIWESLNSSQQKAFHHALSHRLNVVWGPPGTGKSHTLRAMILGAIEAAEAEGKPIRILLTSSTYEATNNLLEGWWDKDLPERFRPFVKRLLSYYKSIENEQLDLWVNSRKPDTAILALRESLLAQNQSWILATTPQQINNLAAMWVEGIEQSPQQPFFDLIILDEASQMDVALSTLALNVLAPTGSLILAGDDLQLAPIHQAEAPIGLENMVGSIYNYYAKFHHLKTLDLQTNYRSNGVIVDFFKQAGYSEHLHSYSADLGLKISPQNPLPKQKPDTWSNELYWTLAWNELLDPNRPALCFVYPDEVSSQANHFEAQSIAALVGLLFNRLEAQLDGELDYKGNVKALKNVPYSPEMFWKKGVGIVTPHNAQKSKVIEALQQQFAAQEDLFELIRSAVDTAEKFQGQQRDVMIASFGVGDADLIQTEEAFLYNLNRFNVMASRARAKLIVFVTQNFLDHLSDDIKVLRASRLLKGFCQMYCDQEKVLELGYFEEGVFKKVSGILRYK